MSRPIYLDYAATTPLDPRVAEAMQQAMRAEYANPASQHKAGREARRVLEEAREGVAGLLGAQTEGTQADRVIFTSGGTEANNLALFGLAGATPCRVLISALEHPSVAGAAIELRRRGYQVDQIRADETGRTSVDHFNELLAKSPRPKLVSVMLVNNETGVIQPVVEEIAPRCRELGVLVHTDAAQAAGNLSLAVVGVDTLSVAAHKFHGPVGIGALVVGRNVKLVPLLHGGFQQEGLRPGTESVVLASGCHTALQLAHEGQNEFDIHVTSLRTQFEHQLILRLGDLAINGAAAPRAPHISNVAFLGVDRQQLFLALDFAGVYCSTGSACASGSSEPSPVLRAMGLPETVISSSLRFSFGTPTTAVDVNEAVDRIVKCVNNLRSRKSVRK